MTILTRYSKIVNSWLADCMIDTLAKAKALFTNHTMTHTFMFYRINCLIRAPTRNNSGLRVCKEIWWSVFDVIDRSICTTKIQRVPCSDTPTVRIHSAHASFFFESSIFLRFYWACVTRFISVFGANQVAAVFIFNYGHQSIPPPPPYEYFSAKILARFYNTQKQLGDGLIWCVKGPRKIPCRLMNIKRESPNFEDISLAEIGTIQLEFKELARQTGNATYKVVSTSHNALFLWEIHCN